MLPRHQEGVERYRNHAAQACGLPLCVPSLKAFTDLNAGQTIPFRNSRKGEVALHTCRANACLRASDTFDLAGSRGFRPGQRCRRVATVRVVARAAFDTQLAVGVVGETA